MHGTPIMLRAQQEGITPEELTEKSAQAHLKDFTDFNIKFDNYHSTHHPLNQKLVEDIFLKLKDKDLINTKNVQQAYDPKANMFFTGSALLKVLALSVRQRINMVIAVKYAQQPTHQLT